MNETSYHNNYAKRLRVDASESDSKLQKNKCNSDSVQNSILFNLRQNSMNSACTRSKLTLLKDKVNEALEESSEIMTTSTPELLFYGLPLLVKNLLEKNQGITSLYEWQDECLRSPSIENRQNVILSLPTSGGKTLIAEILILKEILTRQSDALLILPYVSIVQEKVREMSAMALALNFNIEEYAASKGNYPPKRRRARHTVYVATIEKAHSLVNSLVENNRLGEIGLVVVDELHMILDGEHRGASLENVLTKLMFLGEHIQLIGMSATLESIEDIKKFLNAEMYRGNFRPVELKEYVKIEDNLLEINPKEVTLEEKFIFHRKCKFQTIGKEKQPDPDQIAGLVMEVVPHNSCLVFCPTKKNTENVAILICKGMPTEIKIHKTEEKKALIAAIAAEGNGSICKILRLTIPFGVAYHHSGLTMDERRMLEEAYSSGILCCLTCTSTLAAGVNLPAKRVILRSPYLGKEFLTLSRYKQMIGRAGRAGIDTSGESILIIQPNDRQKVVWELFNTKEDTSTNSSLFNNDKGLKSLILSAIGLQITKTISDIDRFLAKSLLAVQSDSLKIELKQLRTNAIKELIKIDLVKATNDANNRDIESAILSVTDRGRATFKGAVDVDMVEQLHEDLKQGLTRLVLHNYLHLLYLITPYDSGKSIFMRMDIFQNKYMKLNENDTAVATAIGISVSHVTQMACGKSLANKEIVNRFYCTLILHELFLGSSVWDVANEFELHRGTVQQLLASAIGFSSCVYHFCQELSYFWAYSNLFEDFIKQLSHCATAELIPLLELPSVKKGRASLLYKNGYKTIQDIAKAKANELVQSVPFMPRKLANQIIAAAQMLLIEKSKDLKDQAEDLVEGLHT